MQQGSFRFPDNCPDADCDFLVTYQASGDNSVVFELRGRGNWAGVGFSDDNLMVSNLNLQNRLICRGGRRGTMTDGCVMSEISRIHELKKKRLEVVLPVKRATKIMPLVLQHCCKTRRIAMLRVLPPAFKPVLQQIKMFTGLNVSGKTFNIVFQLVLQNKLQVFFKPVLPKLKRISIGSKHSPLKVIVWRHKPNG